MDKFKSGTFFTILIVSMSVGILASIIMLLVDEILVLRVLMIITVGAISTAFVAGLAFLPAFLKIRAVTRALYAVNHSKKVEKIEGLPFGVLSGIIDETNQLIESQIDFQSMRGRLYQQISEVAAQEERNRLARDLHDSIKQQVFSMSVSAAAAHAHLESNPLAAREALVDVRQSAQEAMVEMRVLLQQLAPAPLEQSGLIESMRQQMEALSYRTGARIETEFDKLPSEEYLPIGAQEILFRIAQEALSNIARHARAKHVSLKLKHEPDDQLRLTITDDGQGFDMTQVKRGMGLNNIEQRLEECRGEFICDSAIGRGTTITATIPLSAKDFETNVIEERAKNKKLAETVYHQYMGFAISVAGLIFGVIVGIRSMISDSPMILTMIMGILAIGAGFGGFHFWRNYRTKAQELNDKVPEDDPAHKYAAQHRQECHWIIASATALVLPGSFVGFQDYLWLPNLFGLLILLAIEWSMIGILRNQHAYLKLLLPRELDEAMRAFRLTLTSGIIATVLVTLTVILPGTSTGFYFAPETSEQWDSNFFTGMIFVFVFYHLWLAGLYWHWKKVSDDQAKEIV